MYATSIKLRGDADDKKLADDKTKSDKANADYKARREEKAKSDKAEADDKAKIDEEYRRSQLTAEEKQLEDFTALQKTYLENGNITQGEYNKRIFDKRRELEGDLQVIEETALLMKSDDAFTAIQIAQFEADEKIRINAEEKEKTQAKNKEAAKIAMDLAVTSIAGLQTLSDLAFASKLSKTKKFNALHQTC